MRARKKTPRYVQVIAGVFILFVGYAAVRISPLGRKLSRRILEYQVTNNIDPMVLQQWAMNLMAHETGRYHDIYGTSLPPGLKRVWGYGHDVQIIDERRGKERGVCIFGGGKDDGAFLVVGPPTLVDTNFPSWKPGIYFVGIR